jgi:protein transport protein SEC23
MQKGGNHVSSAPIGAGRTSQFRLPALDISSTLCLFFEITAESKSAEKSKSGEVFNLQFSTKYLHWDGSWRRRITTLSRRWVSGQSAHEVLLGFDQEAAAVMMARYCTWKMETEEDFDATRWIDRALIRLCQRGSHPPLPKGAPPPPPFPLLSCLYQRSHLMAALAVSASSNA